MENFEFKSQIKQRIKNYQDFTSAQEREKYFMDLMIEFEDVEIQKCKCQLKNVQFWRL